MPYLMLALILLASNAVAAEQRAFDLKGAVYLLKEDGTYEKLSGSDTEGRFNFHFDAAHNVETNKCRLRLVFTNSTKFTVRYIRPIFEIFSRRNNSYIGFSFGGKLSSSIISPNGIAQDELEYEKSSCQAITGIEPQSGWNEAERVHVDGLSASDAVKLFNYPDIGVLKISTSAN